MRTPFWIILAALTALGAPAAAHMDSHRDHDEAFEAAGKAEIRKLADILAAVKSKLPGEVVGVELERKHGIWYYEFLRGVPLPLSALEYRLVAYLILHRGRIVPQHELEEAIYGHDEARDSNALEVLVGRVRRKLGVPLIATRRGFGYIVEPQG